MEAREAGFADLYDRFAAALDAGDTDRADSILDESPGFREDFRAPLHGLYLLGKASSGDLLAGEPLESDEPKRLGDFELERELGRGGMGVVYSATQISLRRRVALKILPFVAVLDPRQVARFRNEAQAAASLVHPNIVTVFSVGCERGVHYYSMQLVEGDSLERFIEQAREAGRGILPAGDQSDTGRDGESTQVSIRSSRHIRRVIEMGAQVALALDHAHQQGIVHRDIKPSNLLLDETGKTRVTDFGLARLPGVSNLTSQGERLGTTRYMSPEQATGRNQEVDYRTDIYSLGATLYELLTLQPAFDAPTREQLLAAIGTGVLVPPRKLNPGLPVELETVLLKAMAHAPADRYASGRDFADDLLRCWEGKPVVARRQTVLDRMFRFALARKRLVAGIAAGLVTVAVVAITLAGVFSRQHQREREAAAQARFFLRQAHRVADQLGGLLVDGAEREVRAGPLRAQLLGEAIGYYEDFVEYAGTNPALQLDQALAWSSLASLHERAEDNQKSMHCLKRAIALLPRVGVSSEELATAGLELAACLNRIGLLHRRTGHPAQAKASFDDALACYVQLDLTTRTQPDAVVLNAMIRANLAETVASTGDSGEAVKLYDQAIGELEASKSAGEGRTRPDEYWQVLGNRIGVLLDSDPGRAESELRRCLAEPGCGDVGDPPGAWQADLRNNLAILLSRRNELPAASEQADAAAGFWREQAQLAPQNLVVAERLATVENTRGEIAWRDRRDQAAAEAFQQAESLMRRVIEARDDCPESLNRLAGALHNRSLVAWRSGDESLAIRLIGEAVKIQTQTTLLAPADVRYRRLLEACRKSLSVIESGEKPAAHYDGERSQ